ncbi:MAG: VWA domain-containing protein [Planctomycetota bacterium]|nr:VWA domain-containing protein [Planctomycetota bacterium]MDA1162960.1 VWA domain-containing protein [Planctomycetota bacterium]
MNRNSSFSAIGTSMVAHVVLLAGLTLIHFELNDKLPDIVLETVFDDEREQEEFTKPLETETEIAETQNVIAGGAVSTAVGGSGAPAVAQQKVETSESLQEVDFNVNASTVDLPGENLIGQDLGIGEVNGEVGAMVEGYGAALSRMTQELIRMMRTEKVMAVWLFDESNSMKDDQQEIAQKFHKIYEELGIQSRKDKDLKARDEVLQTSICSFGKSVRELTKAPTTNVNEIKQAIDKIPVDESGDENMFAAILNVVKEFGPKARSQKRRLVIIVVSDESPSDAGDTNLNDYGQIEQAIQTCEKARIPVYCMGREAVFGYPFARIRWIDPIYNLNHWVWINRGPETAYPEALQWDGLHARHDSSPSGFGPYSQVRVCKETGGVYFMLPGEEENIVGRPAAIEARKFQALAMKEYEPLLLSRRDYEEQRARSKFRTGVWDVIRNLNPHWDSKLNMRHWHFSVEAEEFQKQGLQEFEKAAYAMNQLDKAVGLMDDIRPLRAKEDSQRWRAAYDLIYAQCLAYRVRLFQYLLVLDDHAASGRKPKDPKHNRWDVGSAKDHMEPTDAQFDRIKKAFKLKQSKSEYQALVNSEMQKADEAFDAVVAEHTGTPWDARAKWDKGRRFGYSFNSHFWDPKYAEVGTRIKVPKF